VTVFIALLRAVNLGSHNQIAMADLRDCLGQLGLGNPQSLLQSGNLVFQSEGRRGEKLEQLLGAEVEKRLNLRTDFFVRSAEEWTALVSHNPFAKEAKRDPAHLVLVCLKAVPEAAAVKALQAATNGPELVRAVGRQAYIVYPDGIGRSRLTMAMIERKLGTRGTGRNWNTVLKLEALSGTTPRPRSSGRETRLRP
jgi:uncharacterized protein (DUF1697 family)